MKKFFYTVGTIISAMACASTTSDNKETLNPLHIEQTNIRDTTINFESDPEGNIPLGFTLTATGDQQTINWKIVNDNGNKVAAQLAENTGNYYNLLVLDKAGFQNVSISVKIKAVSGKEDQGGGLIWRCIDRNNYYIARYNPLENNFRLYRVKDGNRKQLQSADFNLKAGEWFTMTIEMKENRITGLLNKTKLIEASDDTFKSRGLIGLWTKADAVTRFDDLHITPEK
jgi:hypothetical protein